MTNFEWINCKCKFTLLELLVVIAIIGILLSLLLPSLTRSREKVKRAVCLSNLAQSHMANQIYARNNNGGLPPGNAVLDTAQGVDSVYRFATNMAFGAAIPFHQEYISTPDYFYCPSWTHPYMRKNKRNGNGRYGGYEDPGFPKPLWHYMTSYNYRGVFKGEVREPNPVFDDSSVAYMGDHWAREWGQYVHLREGFNILYIDGHAKFNHDKSQTVFTTNVHHMNDALQDQYWSLFFDE